jgi:hypothetical protein
MTGPLAPLMCEQVNPRLEGLRLAVELYSRREQDDFTGSAVLHAAVEFEQFLMARAVRIRVGDPVITEQGHPARHSPLKRTGPDMAVTIKDTEVATYPAASEVDSKGFPVTGDTITIAEDSAGAVVAMTENADGSVAFAAVAPGSAQVSWTDGTLNFADTINVVSGDAANLVIGEPVVSEEGAPVTPDAPPVTPNAGVSN